jgi:hypothetical protein
MGNGGTGLNESIQGYSLHNFFVLLDFGNTLSTHMTAMRESDYVSAMRSPPAPTDVIARSNGPVCQIDVIMGSGINRELLIVNTTTY